MSTIVRQNVQSCFDTLTLKLNPLNPTLKSKSLDSNKTGWSYIESLSNASNLHEEKSDELEVYVHPLVKRSACMLSDRSLEMCTENLGSETGSDITEDDDIFSMISSSSLSSSSLDSEGEKYAKSSRKLRHHKKDESRKAGYESIPPPLTTMCGAHNMRVQPHRESGRLVMTVVTTSPKRSSIVAERHNGRLSMSLMEDFFDDVEAVEEEEEEEEVNDETNCLIDEREEESAEEEEDQSLEEDINGINKEVEEKFGIGEFQRLSRCKEGGRGTRRLINLETYCVAT